MKKILKKSLAMLLTAIMVVGIAPLDGLVGLGLPEFDWFTPKAEAAEETESYENSDLVYGSDGTITRAEWLHNLAVVFEMTVENEEYPDNYFSDLESTNEYYYDVLLNVQFGVIDVEAGGEVKPNETATREFTTHTLNFCLGYQFEETEYNFKDSADCLYPADAQIALNRGWVALVGGKFMPSQAVTGDEVTAMLKDAAAILGTTVAEENYDSEYIIDSSYTEIPDGTEVVVDSETSTITITDSPETISAGDGFVIYQNSIANAFMAESVSVNGNITTITYSDVAEDDAYEYVDAQGIVDADFNTIEAYDDTEIVYIDDETGNEYETQGEVVALNAARGVKEFNKTFKANRELDFGTGIKASVSVTMKNPKVVYGIKTFEGEAFAYLEGDVSVSYSIKYDAIADLSAACGMTDIRLVNLTVPGVGGFVISVDVSAEGSLSGVNAGTLKTGVQFADGTLRLIKDFKSKDFTLSLEIKATLGLQAKLGLTDLPVFKGYVYAKIGMTGGMKFSMYSGNATPKECRHFSAHLYASAGATVSIKILTYKKSHNISHTIFDENNSPVKISHHYEDGKKVYACTHGKGTTEGDNGYRTPSSSKYNDAGWYGKSSSTGYDSNGNPVTIYTYTLDEDNNATITSYTGNATALNIPEKIDGYTVVGIGANVFSGNKKLHSVKIADTITFIGELAFDNCINLENVQLSQNTKVIDGKAFYNCDSLTSIFIPKSIEKTNGYVSLKGYIGPFAGCDNLKLATFEDGLTVIPEDAFSNCYGLRKVIIPDTVTLIGSYAFEKCSNLKDVQLPNNLVELGSKAFFDCDSLESIYIPKSLNECGYFIHSVQELYGPFAGCDGLKNVRFEENCTVIPGYLFAGCTGLTEIIIPDTVTEIGDHTFLLCENLSEITLSNNIVHLGWGAFAKCTSLEDIYIPNSLTSIYTPYYSEGPFYGCSSLEKVTFEENRKIILASMFAGCTGLKEMQVPETVTKIEDYAFHKCTNLTSLTLPDKLKSIGRSSINGCSSLKEITIPQSITFIPKFLLGNCTSLETILLHNNIDTIEEGAFLGCSSLKTITLPSAISTISTRLFEGCTLLESIIIPENVNSIKDKAFYGCSSLTQIDIHENITNIGKSAFENCISLKTISMTDNITEIGKAAFKGCESLSNITLSSNITVVCENTFADCTLLEEIVIPKGVTTIKENAFLNCVSLKKITIPVTVTSIDSTSLSYPDRTVIYGCRGTYAETYANEYGFKFVDITKHITGMILKDNDEERVVITRGCYVVPEIEYLPADTTDIITLSSNDTSIVTTDGKRLYGKSEGSTTVTATSTGGLEYTFDVYVRKLDTLEITGNPVKTSYNYGEELDLTGLEVTAGFADGASETVTDFTVSGYDPTVYGPQTVIITYGNKEITFTVEVIDNRTKLTSVAITKLPDKIAYEKGEAFDATGMVVTGYYSDGTSAPVTDYEVSSMNSLKNGTQTLTVTYEGFNATFTVTVGAVAVTISSIAVKTNPNKMVYVIGDSFDSTGLVIVATYSDGSTKEITEGYSVGGFDSISAGTKTVNVVYEGKSTSLNVTVKEKDADIKDTFTITFNSNGGSQVNPITAEEGSGISTPANPAKTGYTFAGWTDKNGNAVSVPATMPSKNIVLYAKWSVNSYKVIWVVDGEKTENSVKFGSKINKPANPIKSGYDFTGWTPEIPETMPAEDLTFTAVFKKSGSNNDSPTEPTTKPVNKSSVEIRRPSQTEISYGDSIILHADVKNLPEGAKIVWTADNANFTIVSYSTDKTACTVTPASSGDTVFTAAVVDADGNEICSDTQTMTSKAGFFQKLIAFFKKLFGMTKIIPEVFKEIF